MGRRKCPKNTFCFNDTIIYVVCAIIIVILFNIYFNKKKDQSMINAMYESNRQLLSSVQETIGNIFNFNVSTVSFNKRLTDPLQAPERTTPLFFRRMVSKQTDLGVPINVHTRGEAVHYQQVGVLIQNGVSGDNKIILPIYGKPTYSGSQNWNYYTSTNGYQSMKVAITNDNKECTHEYGCKEINDGNLVSVEGHDSQFKVSLYKLDKPRYIPYVV
jgi:hypothetical protein|tara:strand:- start:822 stop:1469 length:648 start_codon:yes stop_codon:yes gene_type:complete